jgi:hypothetical protein
VLNEIVASLYAWDIADEGVERCLDNLQSYAGVNSTYLVGVMHREKRPLYQRHYPHNPVRKYYTPENSRLYWRPDMDAYAATPIKPLVTEVDFLKGTDWLDVLVDESRKRGMKTGCELSHTILDSAVASAEYPEVLQRDVYGDHVPALAVLGRGQSVPCLNNEHVQAYLLALMDDLTRNHDLDFVQTCLLLFDDGGSYIGRGQRGGPRPSYPEWTRVLYTAAGGCFCAACEARATADGLDWEAIVREVKSLADVAHRVDPEQMHQHEMLMDSNVTTTSLLLENPHLAAWLRFRTRSVTKLFSRIHSLLRERDVEFRYNTFVNEPEKSGLDFRSAFEFVDSVRESDYSDQAGTLEALEAKRQKLLKVRRALGYGKPVIAALGVRIAHESGCDGLSLGHYDGATMQRLAAVKEGVALAEAQQEYWRPPEE